MCERPCKPGSVWNGHLSGTDITARLKPSVGAIGPIIAPVDVAADRVYRPPVLPRGAVSSYLAFPPLPRKIRGGISLLHYSGSRLRQTLSVILALCSPDFPHAGNRHATVQAARCIYYTGNNMEKSTSRKTKLIFVRLFLTKHPVYFCYLC